MIKHTSHFLSVVYISSAAPQLETDVTKTHDYTYVSSNYTQLWLFIYVFIFW